MFLIVGVTLSKSENVSRFILIPFDMAEGTKVKAQLVLLVVYTILFVEDIHKGALPVKLVLALAVSEVLMNSCERSVPECPSRRVEMLPAAS